MTWKIIRGAITGVMAGIIFGGMAAIIISINGKNQDETAFVNTETAAQVISLDSDSEDRAGSLQEAADTTDELIMLQDKIVRFHVKANSNSDEDIELKYQVRDDILEFLKGKISEAESKEETLEILYRYLNEIEERAEAKISEEGYNYDVEVSIENSYFPIRQYGDVVLPAGSYDALTIKIGEAKGENFWCMLYPAICFTTDSAAVVDSESKEELKKALTEEEYNEVFVDTSARKEGRVHISFKFLELFK